jgi:hypothetical protein
MKIYSASGQSTKKKSLQKEIKEQGDMRVYLHKHKHIEAPVRKEGPLGSDVVFAQGIQILLSTLDFENDNSGLAVV